MSHSTVEFKSRLIKPGYDTPGCSTDYVEKVSCTFGDQMYNQMLVTRYGLTICCEYDRTKWDIKKNLLDLKSIYDPGIPIVCCPPTCVVGTLDVFNPLPCPAPEDVIAGIIRPYGCETDNLVVNGNFDTDLSSWIVTPNPTDWIWTPLHSGGAPGSALYAGGNVGGQMTQSILTLGVEYQLSFDGFFNSSGSFASDLRMTVGTNTTVFNAMQDGWYPLGTVLTADTPDFIIEAYDTNNDGLQYMIDNVCIIPYTCRCYRITALGLTIIQWIGCEGYINTTQVLGNNVINEFYVCSSIVPNILYTEDSDILVELRPEYCFLDQCGSSGESCTNYVITNTDAYNTLTVTYIDCEGTTIIITIDPLESTNICAGSIPIVDPNDGYVEGGTEDCSEQNPPEKLFQDGIYFLFQNDNPYQFQNNT